MSKSDTLGALLSSSADATARAAPLPLLKESSEFSLVLGGPLYLADLGNSFEVTQNMRITPFNLNAMLQRAMVTLLPVLPLTLTLFSPEQLLDKLLGMLV
jgi:hypothetical protein